MTEHGKNRLLTLTWLSEPGTATFSSLLPAARQELPVVSVWRWFVQVSQDDTVTVTGCGFNREKGRAEVLCQDV